MMAAFWEKVGLSLNHLELKQVRFAGLDVVLDVLFNNCPNMEGNSFKQWDFWETFEKRKGDGTFNDEPASIQCQDQ